MFRPIFSWSPESPRHFRRYLRRTDVDSRKAHRTKPYNPFKPDPMSGTFSERICDGTRESATVPAAFFWQTSDTFDDASEKRSGSSPL